VNQTLRTGNYLEPAERFEHGGINPGLGLDDIEKVAGH
jgi:hypothetical protein